MAIYHLNVAKMKGDRSAAAKADYCGRVAEYRKDRDQIIHRESGNMPSWATAGLRNERSAGMAMTYWRAADQHERVNGRKGRHVRVALPRELPASAQIELARAFAAELASCKDGALPYSLAVDAGHGHNPHADILISERVNDGIERSAETWFKRAASKGRPAESGGARKTNILERKEWLASVRERWAELANEALERHGFSQRIDHRSNADRGLRELPGVHLGPAAAAMEARGIQTRRGDFLRAVRDQAQEADALDQLELRRALDQSAADAAYERHLRQVEQQRLTAAAVPRPEPARPTPTPSPRPVAKPPQGAPEARPSPVRKPPAPPVSVGHAAWRIEGVQSELRQIEQRRRRAIEQIRRGASAEQLLAARPEVEAARRAVQRARQRLDAVRPSLLDRVRHRLGGPDPRAAERQALELAEQRLAEVRRELLPEAKREAARIKRDASPVPSRRENELRRELRELERQRERLEREQRQARLERKKPSATAKMSDGAKAKHAAPRVTMGPRMGGRR